MPTLGAEAESIATHAATAATLAATASSPLSGALAGPHPLPLSLTSSWFLHDSTPLRF